MEGGDFSSMMTQLGIMNKVSTGNSVLDIILCLLVPVLLQRITPWLQQLYNTLLEYRKRPSTSHLRTIVYQKRSDWITTLGNSNNHHLQEALLFKINIMPEVTKQMVEAEAQLLTNNNMNNKPTIEEEDRPEHDSSSEDGYSDGDHDEWYDGKDCERLEVALVPPTDITIRLTPNITFLRQVQTSSGDGRTEVITTFTLQGEGPGASDALDAFMKQAYDDYRTMLRGKPRDTARYLYMPVMAAANAQSNSDEAVSPFTYRRYKLSEDKSFANFFHPEKQDILGLVHNFTTKAGKFSIAGYPHKLGFLLWGPPGTGKTSFIKALAQLTRRSIVNIPLARIRTNQELMDLMFAQSVQVQGQSSRHYLPFHKVIYVMEDVDAASHVVQRRAPEQQAAGAGALAGPSSAPLMLLDKASEEEEAAAQKASNSSATPLVGPVNKEMAAWLKTDDALNLAGLLNILDGVVDTPGRIVIMTSNHPEKLDPALIRPGRINKKLYMGHLAVTEALGMVRHYFDGVTADQVDRLTKMWVADTVSPATLESMCAEHDTVEQLLAALADTEALRFQQQQQELLRQEAKQQEVARALAAAAAEAAAEAAAAAEAVDGEEGQEDAAASAESTAESPAAAEQEEDGEGGEVASASSTAAAADCDVVVAGDDQQQQCGSKAARKGSCPPPVAAVSAFAAAAVQEQQQDVAPVCDQGSGCGLLAAAAAEVLRQQSLQAQEGVVAGEGVVGLKEECLSIDRQPSTPLRLAP